MQILSQRQLAKVPLKIEDNDSSSEDVTLVKKKSSKRLKKATKKLLASQDILNIERVKKVSSAQLSS